MKISVELSEDELSEITRVTGISKKGPAIRKLLVDAIQLQRRAEISAKFMSGEWTADLKDFEESRAADRSESQALGSLWR